jgi:hypothetical protein
MGISQSPDIAQEIMEDLFRATEEVDVYIEDVGCFNTTVGKTTYNLYIKCY